MGQSPGTVEVGGFGSFTRFDRSLVFDNSFGGGGWLGLYVAPGLALEGSGVYIPTTSPGSADATLIPLNARLVFAQPVAGPVAVLVGAGYVHNMYGKTGNVSDVGVTGLFGLRFGLGSNVAVRVVAVEDFIPSPRNQSASVANNWNFAVQGGLSALLGKSRPKDGDHDGLVDGEGRLSEHAAGDSVDARGCSLPKDSDADGVVDANDRCVNSRRARRWTRAAARCQGRGRRCGRRQQRPVSSTRPGERVDAAGCPLDSDGDGVVDSADKCPATPTGEDRRRGLRAPEGLGRGRRPRSGRSVPRTPAGERVDTNGCPVLFSETQRTLVLQGELRDGQPRAHRPSSGRSRTGRREPGGTTRIAG
jgi:OOP family OmpA-OmpF porin